MSGTRAEISVLNGTTISTVLAPTVPNASDERMDQAYQNHVAKNKGKRLPNTDYSFMNASTSYLEYDAGQLISPGRN